MRAERDDHDLSFLRSRLAVLSLLAEISELESEMSDLEDDLAEMEDEIERTKEDLSPATRQILADAGCL